MIDEDLSLDNGLADLIEESDENGFPVGIKPAEPTAENIQDILAAIAPKPENLAAVIQDEPAAVIKEEPAAPSKEL